MTESRRILDQLNRSYRLDAWHGPAVLQVLEGVSAEQAQVRPISAAHCIWELVLHMACWKSFVTARCKDIHKKVEIGGPEDWPSLPEPTEENWSAAKEVLDRAHQELVALVEQFDDRKLDETYPGATSGWTKYHLLHGAIQHDLYHTGQISILKKGL